MSRQVDTGTGPDRRRLTLEEAQRGDRPTPFTREEWKAMEIAAGQQGRERIARIVRILTGQSWRGEWRDLGQ